MSQVFPDAKVEAKLWRPPGSSDRVQIKCNGTEVANVAQRDMYAKYRWPARKEIVEKLAMYKEEFDA